MIAQIIDTLVTAPSSGASSFLIDNWAELLVGFAAFIKIVVNLIPSDKPRDVFAIFDRIINALIHDRVRK